MIRKQASIVSIREREQWLQQLVSAGALACECHIMFPYAFAAILEGRIVLYGTYM